MFKTLFTAAACGVFLTAAALADEMKACDDATMMMVTEMVEGATDATEESKMMAMEELEMAKAAMADNKMEECSTHLGMAAEAVMMK